MKQLVACLFTLLVFPLIGLCLNAQNANLPEPQVSAGPGPPPPGLPLPIDSGSIILLVAGIVLGALYFITHHKKAKFS